MRDAKTAGRRGRGAAAGKAVAGIRALRADLAQEIPGFAAAVELERGAEDFCLAARADLRDRRKAMSLDQAELARRLDMTQSAISKIEKGEGDLGLKTLYRYAEALGCRPLLLLVPSVRAMAHERGAATDDPTTIVDDPAAAAIQDVEDMLLRGMSASVSEAMATLVKK